MSKIEEIEWRLGALRKLPGIESALLISAEGLILAGAHSGPLAGVGARLIALVTAANGLLESDAKELSVGNAAGRFVLIAASQRTWLLCSCPVSTDVGEALREARQCAASLEL